MKMSQSMDGNMESMGRSNAENELPKSGETKEITPEEIIEDLGADIKSNQQTMERVEESIKDTNARLRELREKLDLPPQDDDAPSVAAEKELLSKNTIKKGELEKEMAEKTYQHERQKLIEEEKKRLLQEKLDGLFKEFKDLSQHEMQNMLKSGQLSLGKNMESKHLGKLDEKYAQQLAVAFVKGVKMLPEILKRIPKLLEEFDEQLTKEAEKNVDEQIEEQKKEDLEKDGGENAAPKNPIEEKEKRGSAAEDFSQGIQASSNNAS